MVYQQQLPPAQPQPPPSGFSWSYLLVALVAGGGAAAIGLPLEGGVVHDMMLGRPDPEVCKRALSEVSEQVCSKMKGTEADRDLCREAANSLATDAGCSYRIAELAQCRR